MIEKVNPSHPDKVADRIAGAIVDVAYAKEENPKVAVEVLIGHGQAHVIIETSADIGKLDVAEVIHRIAGDVRADIEIVPQDTHHARNQEESIHCGDNVSSRECHLLKNRRHYPRLQEIFIKCIRLMESIS